VLKAIMGFQVLIAGFCLWIMIMLRLQSKHFESRKEKAPLTFLFFITFMLLVGEATAAAYTRASATMAKVDGYNLNAVATFFIYLHVAFLPATILWYIHNRGTFLCDLAGDKFPEPSTSKKRKRIFDWVHVGFTFGLLVALMAITTHNSIAYEQHRISLDRYNTNVKVAKNISHACAALVITLYMNTIASMILLNRQIKNAKGSDDVSASTTRSLYILLTSIINRLPNI
jgi:hypothetical protein